MEPQVVVVSLLTTIDSLRAASDLTIPSRWQVLGGMMAGIPCALWLNGVTISTTS